ncbi:MAG: hypothetical protein ABS898_04255 [Psychrobacillus sp.]
MLLDEKEIYCYNCRKKTLFTCRDLRNNKGVESHCSECPTFWFEWQNKAVEREMKKWVVYNQEIFLSSINTNTPNL